jgi:toluene monooxygenase system ferredoxin subunit
MALTRVCGVGDVGPGEMAAFFVDDWEVLVVRDGDGALHALDGICPHEEFPLVYGDLQGPVLTCANHMWSFDVTTGRGINPPTCSLTKYHVEVQGDDIYVDRRAGGAQPGPS